MSAPPTGLKPREIHDNARIKEILLAMGRYFAEGKHIPQTWATELLDLLGKDYA